LFREITKKKDFWYRKLYYAKHTRIQAAINITTGIDLKTPEQGNKKDADCLVHPDELNNGITNDLNAYDLADYVYKPCALSKQTRVIYHNFIRFTTSKLKRVYINFWGFHDPASFASNSYAAVLINDFTRKFWVKFLKTKDQYFDKFKTWLAHVKIDSGLKLRHFKLDEGEEFVSQVIIDFLINKNITLEYSEPYTPEYNPVFEKTWRTLRTAKNAILLESALPNRFWAETINTANYIRNRFPTYGKEITPEKT